MSHRARKGVLTHDSTEESSPLAHGHGLTLQRQKHTEGFLNTPLSLTWTNTSTQAALQASVSGVQLTMRQEADHYSPPPHHH